MQNLISWIFMGFFPIIQLKMSSPRRTLFMFLCSTDGVIKIWQKYHQFGNNWKNFGDFSDNSVLLHITTKLVTEQCKLNMQYCMIHYINQNCSADAKMYHTWLYVKCTMIYDHICAPFWRSVSASGHGNLILNKLPRLTRVWSRPPQWPSLMWIEDGHWICLPHQYSSRPSRGLQFSKNSGLKNDS